MHLCFCIAEDSTLQVVNPYIPRYVSGKIKKIKKIKKINKERKSATEFGFAPNKRN